MAEGFTIPRSAGLQRTRQASENQGDVRRLKQEQIRDILASRKPHQRRDSMGPGSRVLLLLSEQLKNVELIEQLDQDMEVRSCALLQAKTSTFAFLGLTSWC